MGLVSKVMKVGIVAKVVDEARKPHNQEKVKELVAKARSKAQGRSSR